MIGRLGALVALALSTMATAAPLQPTGKWHLYYLPSTCAAERSFGDHVLGFEKPPLGDSTRLIVVGPGRLTETRQLDSLIELSDGGAAIKASSLIYPTAKKGRRGITTVLPPAAAARVANARWLRVSTLGTGPKSKRQAPADDPIMAVELAVGPTTALARELGKCMEDLRRHWGMVDGELPKPAQNAKLSLQGIFRPDDYPRDAMNADQGGSTSYLLMIDEKGAIIDCLVKETSGVASIDGMGCQVIQQRARAKPALDTAGKPVKSVYAATVNWRIAQ